MRRSTGQAAAVSEIGAHRGGGGVDAGQDAAPASVFGSGGEGVGVHVGGAGKAGERVVFGARGGVRGDLGAVAAQDGREDVHGGRGVGGFGARMRCGSASAVEK